MNIDEMIKQVDELCKKDNETHEEYMKRIGPKVEPQVKELLFNSLMIGGLGRDKAKRIADNYKLE